MNELAISTAMKDLMEMGRVFAKSGFFSDSREEAQAVVKIQAGKELGFPPIASMTGIHIIKGKVGVSANLMAAAIKRSPKYTYLVTENTDEVCEIEFFEEGESIGTSRFTKADAERAQTQNMHKFPRNMLFARAMSNGARWHCPDIFGGPLYTPEEMGAVVDAEGDVIKYDVVDKPEKTQAPQTVAQVEEEIEKDFDSIPGASVDSDDMQSIAHTLADEWISKGPAVAPKLAKSWAVDSGYCTHPAHATNALAKVAKGIGVEKMNKENIGTVLVAFATEYLTREMKEADDAE